MYRLAQLPPENKKNLTEFIDQQVHYQSADCHCKDKPEKKNGFIAFIQGLYYLTLAKWFSPLEYELAWLVMEKFRNQRDQSLSNQKDVCSI